MNSDNVFIKENSAAPIAVINNLNFWYGTSQALFNICAEIPENQVTALIGPSGCGKSTFLRVLNRMNDLIEVARLEGEVLVKGRNIYSIDVDVVGLRKQVGMVFQKSNPFPKSIFENIAYGPRIHGVKNKKDLEVIVEKTLLQAGLWDEVKDRLYKNALFLSGGQQQRLCIARALAVGPEVLLMDEPASALDPKSTAKVEELIHELAKYITIVIVTHNLQQAARISQQTMFFLEGHLVEKGMTYQVFSHPQNKHTENYISGRFG